MNKKNFSARDWVTSDQSSAQNKYSEFVGTNGQRCSLAPFSPPQVESADIPLKSMFVPGWKGESLISKSVKKFKDTLFKFQKDAFEQFTSKSNLPKRLKIGIYNEFLSFAELKAINCTELDDYTSFWIELKNENSKHRELLDSFIQIMCFRIAVIYLLKVRFLVVMQDETFEKFDIKNILYPNSYLVKIFKTASSTELKTKAFEQNVFSWYRPSDQMKEHLISFKDICLDLKITEIIKTISIESEKVLDIKTDYSHSLSHKNFGLFLNSLLINFPIWKENLSHKNSLKYKTLNNNLEIISCKFSGDNLESLTLSHWLAQESNKYIRWEQILCPDFKKTDFLNGQYIKIVNELQFLTFLAKIAKIQGQVPTVFISNIINSHLFNRKNSNDVQKSLMFNEQLEVQSTYDRVILNLNHYPKNNPQHFLFNKIAQAKADMKDSGYLYVMTSKKIFVPSQKSKIDQLLKDLKLEGIINLSGVEGKGEIGEYIYIFSKQSFNLYNPTDKQACINFRLSSQLRTFQKFQNLTSLLQDFFINHTNDLPPLFQKVCDDARLEFYQDAISNGQLIHSSSKDSSKITHPLFFKKMMGLCNPLDYFFEIQNIDFDPESKDEEDTLFNFSNTFERDEAPYTIVIDKRNKHHTKLEIIKTSTLELKSYEYGHALCSYFYAYPKWPHLNIESIRDYFTSNIGSQIINLTFSTELRKIKSNLNKILIPKYFANVDLVPEHIAGALSIFKDDPSKLLSYHPNEIKKNYEQAKNLLISLVKKYPSHCLQLNSQFSKVLTIALEKLGHTGNSKTINFNNPLIKSPLLMSKTYGIYPSNEDIYIEFNSDAISEIHAPLTHYKKTSVQKGEYATTALEVYANDCKILTIFSDEQMLNFLEFLLENVKNIPISKVLQGLQVPRSSDLKSILSSYQSLKRCLEEINGQLPNDFDALISSTIFS